MIALIDCNNFFVSCERIFRPDLEGKPVAVLSSNDGCAVARSNEVKALGIPMGAPAFKYRHIFEKHNIIKFSANFELYGNISRRITSLLTSITPNIEIYSVDESFLDLSELPIKDYEEWGRQVRRDILDWIGIPVSIGIAPTKTLAKVATSYAKKHSGVALAIPHTPRTRAILEATAVRDVWGVGWRNAPKLKAEGIINAYLLSKMLPKRARQLMGIQGRQMAAELNGMSCFPLQYEDKPAKSISRTRTFGQDIDDINAIRAAIADFTTRACFKLRYSKQLTKRISLFIATNKHRPNYRWINGEITLRTPTNDTGEIISLLTKKLDEIYPFGLGVYRAGVFLHDFTPDNIQTDIFDTSLPRRAAAAKRRMSALDYINEVFGKGKLMYASQKLGNSWRPRKENQSPRYVSRWGELPEIKPAPLAKQA